MAIALLFGLFTVLRPVDITIWSVQSKLVDSKASGNIAYLPVDADLSTTGTVRTNRSIARNLRIALDSGARRVFLDLPVKRSNNAAVDRDLARLIHQNSDRVWLTIGPNLAYNDVNSRDFGRRSDPRFVDGTKQAYSATEEDFLGFVWDVDKEGIIDDVAYPSLANAIAGQVQKSDMVHPDYSIRTSTIPVVQADSSATGTNHNLAAFHNRDIVMGLTGDFSRVPDSYEIPSSLIHIIAAETLLRGRGGSSDWQLLLPLIAFVLIAGLIAVPDTHRKYVYFVTSAILAAEFARSTYSADHAFLSVPSMFLVTYGLIRAVMRYKRRHLLIDERTSLPNFAALRKDWRRHAWRPSEALIVVKVIRSESVFSVLTERGHALYINRIAERLAIGAAQNTVYYDGGKYLAFVTWHVEAASLESHLAGMRALASQPVTVDGAPYDVSVTMGGVSRVDQDIISKLESATALADRGEEVYHPVTVLSEPDGQPHQWDYSLQAKLDNALDEDRIFVRLQPQVDLASGRVHGCEALVRWDDQERGELSPVHFIDQSERVGRLDALTERVFEKSFAAMASWTSRRSDLTMSVNVSAIQLGDRRLIEMLGQAGENFNVDWSRLIIEVTESARIEDYRIARSLLDELKDKGASIALDDFGVDRANFDTLYHLPVDEVKIDRMFIERMSVSPKARAMVESVVRLCHDTDIRALAEGIETAESLRILREIGCPMGQGFFLAKPILSSEFNHLIENEGFYSSKVNG